MKIDPDYLEKIRQSAKSKTSVNKAFFKQLKQYNSRKLDDLVHQAHEKVFNEVNCLECANCCKLLGPQLFRLDIKRMAAALKMKTSDFMDRYIKTDEDNDMVFNRKPCPFLAADNYCSIYDNRPRACREYPHTDRRKFYQLLDKTLKNIPVCPAAYRIVETLKDKINL